jgi:xanthine/CO dehydrogenase XdhC/CoxF family maturation factor
LAQKHEFTEHSIVTISYSSSSRTWKATAANDAQPVPNDNCVEVFLEVIQPPVLLLIFGAGQEALPLTRIAKCLGWNAILADPRPGLALADRFPLADKVICGGPAKVLEEMKAFSRVAAVVMTHNYMHDFNCLRELNSYSLDYVGLLGPKQRTLRLMQELASVGASLSSLQMENLFTPIGLDIGAETEEEIALSIAAEVQSVMAHRPGSPLRARSGPIHSVSVRTDSCPV